MSSHLKTQTYLVTLVKGFILCFIKVVGSSEGVQENVN